MFIYEIQTFEYIIHESLKNICSILEAETYVRKFVEAGKCNDDDFRNAISSHGNSVMGFNEVDFRDR